MEWPSFKVHYRYLKTNYIIQVDGPSAGKDKGVVVVDGVEQTDGVIRLIEDQTNHQVSIHQKTSAYVATEHQS